MPTTAEYLGAAAVAAARFGLDATAITLLSHSENVVYEVVLANNSRVALRLHRPGYNTRSELESEVEWVQSLRSFGIPVPAALTTPEGDHYITVPVAGEDHQVGVVAWVDGASLGGPTGGEDSQVVEHYAKIGSLAAQIRLHHDWWTPPPTFTRRAWDRAGLVGSTPLWDRFWETSTLSRLQRRLFSNCRDQLDLDLRALSMGPDRYGMIHSDLHLGNVMADGNDLTIIDFDDAGFGWFAHELAVALHPVFEEPWEDAARVALLDGYREVIPLSAAEEAAIDTFLTVRCLMIVGWLAARRELPIYEHFDELAAQAERAARRYLARS